VVVVIDDDALVLDSMGGLLRKWGCEVATAESAQEALAGLARLARGPDLIISDDRLGNGQSGIRAIALLRAYWGEASISSESQHYPTTLMAMEPKPPQGRGLPLWIGGGSEAAYRRVGRLGDGWLASRVADADDARRSIDTIHRYAAEAGRDPAAIGLQSMVAPSPRDAEGKRFYAEPDRVVARVTALKTMGFGWVALNATAIFQAGARSVAAMTEQLGTLHDRLRAEVG